MTTTTLPRRVIVDDTDPRIQYSIHRTWSSVFVPETNETFRTTFHTSNGSLLENFTNLSFRFRGSSPLVFGYNPQTQHVCSVNGTGIGPAPVTTDSLSQDNSALLCDGTQFTEEGEYTLTLNVTGLPPDPELPLCFDYITYIPPASAQAEPATVLVDKSDPAISYVGNWTTTDASYDSAIFTQTTGSHLIFNFTGTSVSWIGFIPTQPVGANYTYSVDGGKSRLLSLHPSPFNNLSSQIFFTSPSLSYGLHSLVVEKTGGDTGALLTLNNFMVTNGSALTPSSLPPPIASSSPPPIASSVPTPSTSANGPNLNTSILGAIIGGVIGGIVILCIASFLVWRYHLWRRNSHSGRIVIDPDNTTVHQQVTPFDSTAPFGSTMPKLLDHAPKSCRAPMENPPGIILDSSPDGPPDVGGANVTPQAPGQNLNAMEENEHEDSSSARSAASRDKPMEPPPSYFSYQ
ncbi:hypothetical protein BD779DRAFT_1668287 [Infundibulicybe gibba]|nr:hypothetical protein BD779DRAFT_1668287 [Infundibulicybe gibba]